MPVYESTPAGLLPLSCTEAGNPMAPAGLWMDLSSLGASRWTRCAVSGPSLPRRASLESRAALMRCFQSESPYAGYEGLAA